jgi:hypothetical protein
MGTLTKDLAICVFLSERLLEAEAWSETPLAVQ